LNGIAQAHKSHRRISALHIIPFARRKTNMIKVTGKVILSEQYPDHGEPYNEVWLVDEDNTEIDIDDTMEMFGKGAWIDITFSQVHENDTGDLWMKIGDGNAVVRADNNEIEFTDCTPISIEDLEYVISEANAFIAYRESRRNLSMEV
jgi:hypothetical protein